MVQENSPSAVSTKVSGAEALDGNSNDWRYIQVRRTLIYVEQSIKQALDPFVFAANDADTWSSVVSRITSFLEGLWSQGGIVGDTAGQSYTVECGVGSSMTTEDVRDGRMIVQVQVQMTPTDIVEITSAVKVRGS